MLSACIAATAEERLPEIVVTAPPVRDETPAPRDPTAFASVIETREAPTTVDTLTEALSETVGVQVRRFGGLGDFSTVSVRGFSPGQVQVYLDGVPLSRADNEVVDLSQLPLDAVDHVEVYRGTTPLAFSQAGPGGVVNVVTRRPGAEPLAATSASYGSFATRKGTLAGSDAQGPWDGLVFAQYLGSRGDFPYTNSKNTEGTGDDVTQHRINNTFNQGDLTGRLAYRAAPFTLALTSDTFVKSQGVPGRDTLQSPTAHRNTFRQIAHLDLDVAPTTPIPVGVVASLYGVQQTQTFTAAGPPEDLAFAAQDSTDSSTTIGGQVLARAAFGAHHVPGVLVASSVERFENRDTIGSATLHAGTSPAQTRTRLAVAGQDEVLLLNDRLSLVPNLRWEFVHDVFPGDPRSSDPAARLPNTTTRDYFMPRLGARADAGHGLTLLGNVGRSVRIPNLTELFGTSGVVRGNPDLQPETATSWDVGFRLRSPWTNRVLTDGTVEYAYFSSDLEDAIVIVPSSVNLFTSKNIGGATIRGQEVSGRAAMLDRLALTTNYTHQDATDTGDDGDYRGKQLPGRPAHEAYARLELFWAPSRPLPLGAWAARAWPGRVFYDVSLIADNFLDRANVRRVGSRTYHGVGLDLTLPWRGVHLAWELKNFTNDQTADALGFPLPGRSMFLTVSYGFDGGRS